MKRLFTSRRCRRVGCRADVHGEVDDFEVFVEHVKSLSADEDFGVSRRKLDLGGHHGEEELAFAEREAGEGVDSCEIVLIAVIIHRGDWVRIVDVGVCGERVLEREFICMTYRALIASVAPHLTPNDANEFSWFKARECKRNVFASFVSSMHRLRNASVGCDHGLISSIYFP